MMTKSGVEILTFKEWVRELIRTGEINKFKIGEIKK